MVVALPALWNCHMEGESLRRPKAWLPHRRRTTLITGAHVFTSKV